MILIDYNFFKRTIAQNRVKEKKKLFLKRLKNN